MQFHPKIGRDIHLLHNLNRQIALMIVKLIFFYMGGSRRFNDLADISVVTGRKLGRLRKRFTKGPTVLGTR